MSTQHSGPPTSGLPQLGKMPSRMPGMMIRPPFPGPPTMSGMRPTFNGRPMGPPTINNTIRQPTLGAPRLSGPPTMGGPHRGPPLMSGSATLPTSSIAPSPPTSQMQSVSLSPRIEPLSSLNFNQPSAASPSPSPYAPPISSVPLQPHTSAASSIFPPQGLSSSSPFGPSTNTPAFTEASSPASTPSHFGPTQSSANSIFPPQASYAPSPFGPPSSVPSPFTPQTTASAPMPTLETAAPSFFPSQSPSAPLPFGAPTSNAPSQSAAPASEPSPFRPPSPGPQPFGPSSSASYQFAPLTFPPQSSPAPPSFPPQTSAAALSFPPQSSAVPPSFPPQSFVAQPSFPPQNSAAPPSFLPQNVAAPSTFPLQSSAAPPSFPPQSSAAPSFPPQSSAAPPSFPPQSSAAPPSFPPQSFVAQPSFPPQSSAAPPGFPQSSAAPPSFPPQSSAAPSFPPQSSAAPPGFPQSSASLPSFPPQSSAAPSFPPQSSAAPPSFPPQSSAAQPSFPPQSSAAPLSFAPQSSAAPPSFPSMSAPAQFGAPPPMSAPSSNALCPPSLSAPSTRQTPPSMGPARPGMYQNSYSPGLQGIQSGQATGPLSGPPSQFGGNIPSQFGAPPSQFGAPNQPPMGPPPMSNGSSAGQPPMRGYAAASIGSAARRPYPSNQSYGVSQPASLNQAPLPAEPTQPQRHPTAPIIANPGAGLQGQLPTLPQPAPPGPPGGAKSRIDPDLMPNPLSVQDADKKEYNGKQWITTTPGVPPLVSTNVPMIDAGNCSPRYIRATLYTMPANKDLANQINMPLSFAVQPLAPQGVGEAPLVCVDMSVLGGPLRCRRCKAYINPHVKFVDGGRKFICNLCNVDTEVPAEYFCNLDHTGRRADAAERPELSRGSYELLTTTDYCKGSKMPQAPAYIFVIDVTFPSFQSGMVQALTQNITAVLANLPRELGQEKSSVRVGFITYAQQIHYYNLNPNLAQPGMLVQSDLSEVFVPMVEGFLVTQDEAMTHIKTLMDLIPTLHSAEKKGESLLLPAIQAGCAALKAANRPGKVIMFHSSLPTAPGPGQLKNREDKKLLNTEKESSLLTPADPIFETVARECVDNGVAVDLFLFPHAYIDVASIGKISTVTGGSITRYPMFKADTDGERFIQDLAMHIAQPCVFDAVLRMRTNAGIRPVDFCGNFMMQNATDMEMAVVLPSSCVTVEIKHDDKLPEDLQAYVQVALLYTSISGQRKLRLHNLALPVSLSLNDLFKSCDVDTISNSLTKEYGKALLNSHTYKQLKENLVNRISNALACYRQHCAAPSQPGQLILPETLKLLPLYCHCLLRSPALMPSLEVGFDEKSNLLQRLAMMGVESSELFLYPRLYSLNVSTMGNEGMPPIVRSSYDRIRESGPHLLENGLVLILWVGQNTPSKWLQDVLGATVLDQVDPSVGNLQPFDNPTSVRVRSIIDMVRQKRQTYLRLNIVRQKDKTEHIFNQFLVEDKTDIGVNYTDFLCAIHREIRNILS